MNKNEKLRAGAKNLFSETRRPSEAIDRLIHGTDRSVPDKLWSLRERIKGLRSEAEELSSLMDYHSGSRLSQVVDVLTQAEKLTEETMSLTGQAPRD